MDIKPVSPRQSYALAVAYNLGAKSPTCPEGGFAAFVPFWKPVSKEVDAGEEAAKLLNSVGADHASAKAALDYLIDAKPVSEVGKAHRVAKGVALLLKKEVPKMPVEVVETPKPVQVAKDSAGQLALAEFELAQQQVRLAEAKVKAIRAGVL